MDVTKAFTYVFDDDEWITKMGMGVLMTLLAVFIVPALMLGGWLVATTRNVIDGKEHPLAAWDDLGGMLKDGGVLFLASLVYSSPFILLFCVGLVATVGLGGLSEVSEDAAVAGIFATFGLLGCLGLLMGLALFFIMPAVTLQYVRTNELSACFRFGEVFGILRDHIGDIAIVAITPFVINIAVGVAYAVPFIGLCIGPVLALVATPYTSAVSGHLYGQLALKTSGKNLDTF